jgi:hypothetical protein
LRKTATFAFFSQTTQEAVPTCTASLSDQILLSGTPLRKMEVLMVVIVRAEKRKSHPFFRKSRIF